MKNIFLLAVLAFAISCNNSSFTDSSGNQGSPGQSSSTEALALRSHVHQLLREEQRIEDSLASIPGLKDTISCGTFITEEQYDTISAYFDNVCQPELVPDDTTTVLTYPVHFFVVTKKRANAPASSALIQSAFAALRARFRDCRIDFELSGVDTVNSDALYDFKQTDEPLVLRRRKTNAISIFIFNTITVVRSTVPGYTPMGGGPNTGNDNFIMLTGTGLQNGTTFFHEMGHYFLLYHTHGKTNDRTTDELVARDGCSCSGDDVCDTPADPNLGWEALNNCRYTGTRTDAAGMRFTPDPTNLMSYGESCRKNFTAGQYRRMRWAALKYRTYFRQQAQQ